MKTLMQKASGTVLLICASMCVSLLPASAAKTGTIYSFTGGADGAVPFSTLTPDAAGNVYGTTQDGGGSACDPPTGCGTVFKLDRAGNLNTLHAFAGGLEGADTESGVSFIRGVLYGNAPLLENPISTNYTSIFFSINTDGSDYRVLTGMTVHQGGVLVGLLQPAPDGGAFGLGEYGGDGFGTLFHLGSHEGVTIEHSFASGSTDGHQPNYLIEGSDGVLFGSTQTGGGCTASGRAGRLGCGVIFKYVPQTGAYSVLYAFQGGADGYLPLIGAVGPDGTLYGVTTYGGTGRHGALFALTPDGSGYSFKVLTPILSPFGNDGANNPPTLSPDGALVGGTYFGGSYVYQNGSYAIYFDPARRATEPLGQFFVPRARPHAFLGTSVQGGTSAACNTSVFHSGCGFIYYGAQ